MPDPLQRVRQASQHRLTSEHEYREAVREAIRAGHNYSEIGKAAGVSRQAIRQAFDGKERT